MDIWIVGRHIKPDVGNFEWELMGVFDSKEKAIAACTVYYDYIFPGRLNERLPDEPFLPPGLEYPLNPDFHPTE
jgi:hypothetical protein